MGTGEFPLSRSRSCREFSQRFWSLALSSSRMVSETWEYTPRMPGTVCPSRSAWSTSGMASSSIQVL